MIWQWDMTKLIQIFHAEGVANGLRFRWSKHFGPSQEIINKFDAIAARQLELDEL